MTPDEFGEVLDAVVHALRRVSNDDWSERAGDLDWSCWQTADHMIDVVFSYALQFAAGAQGGFLPFQELHAQPGAAPSDLIEGVEAVSSMLAALVRQAPPTATASDGVLPLDGSDWCARAAYELVLHTNDILRGLGLAFEPSAEWCTVIMASPALWMLDRIRAREAGDPWSAMLAGSGRETPSA